MAPKILMITSYDFSGRFMQDMARGFSERDNILGFISLTGASTPEWADRFPIADYSRFFANRKSFFWRVVNTIRVIRLFSPDVVQTHLFMGGIIGLISGKLMRKPVILTRHHIDEHYQVGSRIHRAIDRFCAKNVDHVIVCSQAAKKWLVEVEGVSARKITVMNQGFDFDELTPTETERVKAREALGFSDATFNIICVARYSRTKGQEYLVEAAKLLINRVPNLSIVFVGPGDSVWLESMIAELGLTNVIRVLPSRSDIPACIAAADLVVHPSLVDSFSQLIIEAQAIGGPIIASDIAAAREQIVDRETGVIVPPKNVQSLADEIEGMYNNPQLRLNMAAAARVHVRQSFTLDRMISEEIECVERVLKV